MWTCREFDRVEEEYSRVRVRMAAEGSRGEKINKIMRKKLKLTLPRWQKSRNAESTSIRFLLQPRQGTTALKYNSRRMADILFAPFLHRHNNKAGGSTRGARAGEGAHLRNGRSTCAILSLDVRLEVDITFFGNEIAYGSRYFDALSGRHRVSRDGNRLREYRGIFQSVRARARSRELSENTEEKKRGWMDR